MDSRIEELARIIAERAGDAINKVLSASDGRGADRCHSWRRLHYLAREMQTVIDDYRSDHPEEYEFIELTQALGMAETYKAEMIAARQELARYKEREATQGWAPI